MKEIKVDLGEKGHNIVVGLDILKSLGQHLKKLGLGKDAVVVTNPTIKKRWGSWVYAFLKARGFRVRFEEVPDTEKAKSAKICLELLERLAVCGKSRTPFIIAFGGGVVGDIAGFAAAIFKRGVAYVQVPTTLVAQVDSAIGGKTAIDLQTGKNMIGAFHQPRLIFSEIRFLSTLHEDQIREGLSEVIKYGVIKDPALFGYLEKNLLKVLRRENNALRFIVERASRIKAKVVEQDEFDRLGIRIILNYGHTLGHAIEAAGGYGRAYTHGRAISLGMLAANFISQELGLIQDRECSRIKNILKEAGLPTRVRGLLPRKIYTAHLYDKKFMNGKNRFVLPLRIGRVKIAEGVPDRIVKKAINFICA